MTRDRSHHAERQNSAKLNGLGDICEKLLSVPYVLFLVTAAMFFDESKIPTSILCSIPQGAFIPIWFQFGQVVSEEKIFERNNVKIAKMVEKGQ